MKLSNMASSIDPGKHSFYMYKILLQDGTFPYTNYETQDGHLIIMESSLSHGETNNHAILPS